MAEVANIAALGLRGVKFHPSLQAFSPDDPAYQPIFAACERHGLLALFHTGTSGIGARQPGGQGIRLDYAHPLKLDAVAAAHPGLTVVAAHFGWPWHMDLIAMALHKTNVYIDISGWSPRRIPPRWSASCAEGWPGSSCGEATSRSLPPNAAWPSSTASACLATCWRKCCVRTRLRILRTPR